MMSFLQKGSSSTFTGSKSYRARTYIGGDCISPRRRRKGKERGGRGKAHLANEPLCGKDLTLEKIPPRALQYVETV